MGREDVFSDPHLKAQFSEGDYPLLFTRLEDGQHYPPKLRICGQTKMFVR